VIRHVRSKNQFDWFTKLECSIEESVRKSGTIFLFSGKYNYVHCTNIGSKSFGITLYCASKTAAKANKRTNTETLNPEAVPHFPTTKTPPDRVVHLSAGNGPNTVQLALHSMSSQPVKVTVVPVHSISWLLEFEVCVQTPVREYRENESLLSQLELLKDSTPANPEGTPTPRLTPHSMELKIWVTGSASEHGEATQDVAVVPSWIRIGFVQPESLKIWFRNVTNCCAEQTTRITIKNNKAFFIVLFFQFSKF
jgi:hypothetical protein